MEGPQFQRIQEICSSLEIGTEQLFKLKNDMTKALNLSRTTESEKSILNCRPTFVQEFPHGCEYGPFLAINLKENNFRINLFQLNGESEPKTDSEYYDIDQNLLRQQNIGIFEHISESLHRFLKKRNYHRDILSMVLSTPLALKHDSLNHAMLLANASLHLKDLRNKDIGQVLQEAIWRKNPRVHLKALINESTAVLLAGSWRNSSTKIGLVVGSDVNVAYTEKDKEFLQSWETIDSSKPCIIHLDWNCLEDKERPNPFLIDLQKHIDLLSSNLESGCYGKLLNGSYVSEMARQIFVMCTNEGILFNGELGRILTTPFSFTIRHAVEVLSESFANGNFDNSRLMFDRLGVMKPNDVECSKVLYILECVTKRAAALMAVLLSCLIEKIGESHVVIAIDGSFYRNNSIYHKKLENYLGHLISIPCSFELKYIEDGIGKGSALAANIATRQSMMYYDRKEESKEAVNL